MNPKFSAVRAIGSLMLEDVLRVINIIVGSVLAGLLILSWWLTANVSAWWGIFLAMVVIFILLAMAIRFFAVKLLQQLYPAPLDATQRQKTKSFVTKLQNIAAVRSMGWPAFIMMSLKDLFKHRDLLSLKNLISETSTLRGEFSELEQLFRKK